MLKSILTAALLFPATALAATPPAAGDAAAGAKLYAVHCASCHGANREGIPEAFPALTDVGKRLDPGQLKEKIRQGGGLMPAFGHLSDKEIEDLAAFLQQQGVEQ